MCQLIQKNIYSLRFENSANHDEFRDIPRINTSKKTIEEVADCIIEKCKIKGQKNLIFLSFQSTD